MKTLTIFRIIAFLEGLSYILLLFIGVPLKYFGNDVTLVKMTWNATRVFIHGIYRIYNCLTV